ncbi:MAG: patatin-like phospholipase family protein [Candidatus Anstonellales archaeon]
MAMPAELKELSRCIDPTARGDKKTLGVIAQRYFENNREKLKEDPTSHGPTGLCFDYNLFVKNGNMSIVFEGGGIKGYAHLGAYLALLEEGMLPKNSHIWFYGTSAGAVAAIACSLITSGKMTVEEAYRKFAFHPVYLIFFVNFGYNPFNGRLIRWRVESILKKKGIKTLTELRTAVTSVLEDKQRKEYYLAVFGPKPFVDVPLEKVDEWRFGKGLSIGKIVQSSCAMPGLFTAGVVSNAKLTVLTPAPPYTSRVPFGKRILAEPGPPATIQTYNLRGIGLLTDGGTKANLPTIVALATPKYRKESDLIYAINIEIEKRETRLRGLLNKLRYANPKTRVVRFLKNMLDASIQALYLIHIRNNFVSTMKRTIDSMMDEIAERGNALCMHGNIVKFDIKIPNIPLWRPDKAGELVLEGYRQVKEQIKQLKELGGVI